MQYFSCKEFGHITHTYPTIVCKYCKKEGHIIKDCRVRPQHCHSQAFQVAAQSASSSSAQPTVSSNSSVLTPAIVQQMIVFAFTTFNLKGMSPNSTSWIVDAGTSNHMTSDLMGLHGVHKYSGKQNIQIGDSNILSLHYYCW